jgi:hypothetical protein
VDGEDAMTLGDASVTGYLTFALNENLVFELTIELDIQGSEGVGTTKKLVIDAEMVVPFMVNVAVHESGPVPFTAATLHGVVTTGPRPPFLRNPNVASNFGQLLNR